MANEPISRPEAKQRLSGLVDDLARHVDYLREENVKEVTCSPGIASESPTAPATPPKAARPQPKQTSNIEHRTSNIQHRMGENDAVVMSDADVGAKLKTIALEVAACKKCGLHEGRHKAVPGQGNIHPDILFIGEGPGGDEDMQGVPFVGRAGKLLTRLITRMGYTRDEVFIANIIKCRPPSNRKPLPDEMAACFPYLQAQIALLKPRVIVALGATALEALVSPMVRISRTRGHWQEFDGIPLMPTYHPSYLLRNQSAMWDVWNDMQSVLKRLGRTPPPASAKSG